MASLYYYMLVEIALLLPLVRQFSSLFVVVVFLNFLPGTNRIKALFSRVRVKFVPDTIVFFLFLSPLLFLIFFPFFTTQIYYFLFKSFEECQYKNKMLV